MKNYNGKSFKCEYGSNLIYTIYHIDKAPQKYAKIVDIINETDKYIVCWGDKSLGAVTYPYKVIDANWNNGWIPVHISPIYKALVNAIK